MDANVILTIVEDYKRGLCTFAEASLALIVCGCSPEEVIELLKVEEE